MALSQNNPRAYELGDMQEYPVAADAVIYEGSAVGKNGSGYARALQAGDAFLGFSMEPVDNTGGADGAVRVQVREEGKPELTVSNLAITDLNKPVYASDDNTFVLTASGNSYIGKVQRFVSAGVGIIAYNTKHLGAISSLTDNTGGTVSTTLAAIPNTTPADLAAQGTINGNVRNAIASLTAQVNALAQALK
jgi:hypothetical protein